MPHAAVLAILDGGPPVEPEPRLHLMGGGRPRLLLVGGDDEQEVQQRLDRVVHLWGLPRDRYSIRRVVDHAERRRRILGVTCGGLFGIPAALLVVSRGWTGLEPGRVLAHVFGGGDPGVLVALLALALVPGLAVALWYGWQRSWPTRESWFVGISPLFLVVAALVPAGVFDGVEWLNRHVPAFGVVLIGTTAIAAIPVLASYVEAPAWRAALGWGLPLLAGGIAPFVGELLLEVYLGRFGITRPDVQVSFWAQWLLGAAATVGCALGVYIGVALWAVCRRLGRVPFAGVVMAILVAAVYLLTVAQVVVMLVEQRAQVSAEGVPGSLFGLWPRLACVEATAEGETYSYVGRPVDRTAGPVVYFGRADGRLAVWSPGSGGVLLDGQAVSLRFVEPGDVCG
jgi:hypothetical protein